jgi:hypothetical protein
MRVCVAPLAPESALRVVCERPRAPTGHQHRPVAHQTHADAVFVLNGDLLIADDEHGAGKTGLCCFTIGDNLRQPRQNNPAGKPRSRRQGTRAPSSYSSCYTVPAACE